MIRFCINEYIRNFWFNLCIIMLLLVMMIISTVLISNVDNETGTYRLSEKYMDEDSMFLSRVFSERMEELNTYGEVFAVQVFNGVVRVGVEHSVVVAIVYSEEVMEHMKPRLDSGTYPEAVKSNDNIVRVLISHNPYGFKAGDTFTYEIFTVDGKSIEIPVYVAGVISEGQRLHSELQSVSVDMVYDDFFPVYSYEQTEMFRMIILEDEMQKLPEDSLFFYYGNIIINPDDDLSTEERTEIWEKIVNYELEFSSTQIPASYPSALELVERNNIVYKSIIMKYLPLSIIVILLFCISIVGMVTIKTVKSIRYYGIMYTCGMQYSGAQLTAGMEMVFNCVLAFIMTITLLTLQEKFDIVGEINCNLDTLEVLVMLGICMIMVVGSVLTTRGVLKEHTPVEILKNTN